MAREHGGDCVVAYLQKAVGLLHERRDREGRGAAPAGIARHEDVVDVGVGLAHVVPQPVGHALDHGLDGLGAKGLLRAVGRNAERLAQKHCRVLSEERTNSLHLLGAQPTRHRSQLVSTLLRMVRFEAVVAHLWCTRDSVGNEGVASWVRGALTSVILIVSKMLCP